MEFSVPYREQPPRTRLAFSLSALLHGLLVASLVFFAWHRLSPEPPQQPKALELVAGPPTDSPAPPAPAENLQPNLPMASLTPLPPTPEVKPQPTPPEPPPPQKSDPTPAKPTTVTTIKPPPIAKSGPKPAPNTPAASSPVTDYKTYLQQHPQSNSSAASSSSTQQRRVIPPVGVQVGPITPDAKGGGPRSSSRGPTSVTNSEKDAYIASLIARLRGAFIPPGGVSGLSTGLTMTIAANGTVISAKILLPSGNEQFDAAVEAALRDITQVDPPPGGQEVTYRFAYTPSGP